MNAMLRRLARLGGSGFLAGILGCGGTGSAESVEAGARPPTSTGASSPDGGWAADAATAGADAGADARADAGTSAEASASTGGYDAGAEAGAAPSCDSLPPEPVDPPACTTLAANLSVAAGAVPDESSLDTVRIQTALDACPSGHSVRLATSGSNAAFVSGPLTLPGGVTLWVDAGVTLFASRSASAYGPTCGTTGGTCSAFIGVRGAGSGIVGKGAIHGQGGEPMLGQTQSWWELTGSTNGGSANPALVETRGASSFTMHSITLHDSPKFHVKLDANGFVVWGVTIKTPAEAANSQGTALTPAGAHNTDGIDPGESASNGYIVDCDISDGDDQIAIKGGTSVHDLVIAHNHFLAGHGMSIGSETNGGVSRVSVCDLSIDGTAIPSAGSSNGIRIKSYPGVGGLVTGVTYTDVCVRGVTNPIVLTPFYASGTGSIPEFDGITIRDFHSVGTSPQPKVTIDGYDASHVTGLTLDGVAFDVAPSVTAEFANVTVGPGGASFVPSGNGVTVGDHSSGTLVVNPCAGKWVSF